MEREDGKHLIKMPRKQHGVVDRAIGRWEESGVIDKETGARLRGSIAIAPFDWQRTARYAFLVAVACLLIAVVSVLSDGMLMMLLGRLFSAPDAAKCAILATVSGGFFAHGLSLRKRCPGRAYRNEAVFFLGVLALAGAIAFLGAAIGAGSGNYRALLLMAAVLYASLGLWFPSAQVWVFGLISLGA